ncbi:MAG: type II secretion system F family protein [Candidatus Levyibacteriota bacterium]
MQYTYNAVNASGIKQKGLLEANSEKEVIDYLRENALIPITVVKVNQNSLPFLDYFSRITGGDVVLFTRQLASMTMTGLTLIESLNILKDQTAKPKLQELIQDLIASISGGASFSTSLSYHKEVFSDVYIALVKAAESGGIMDKILGRLADNLEKSEDLKKKVRSAMFYPAIVMSGIFIVVIIMNVFVMPQLSKLYEGLNVSLPLTTRIVLGISNIFSTFFPVMIILAVVGVFVYRRISKTPNGKEFFDTYKLKIPIIGSILTLSIEDEVGRTLSLLIASGTSILEGLTITANVAGNSLYKKAILSSASMVEKGISLSSAFEQQKLFPPIFVQMTKVGESTGKIDENLERVAAYFERDLDLKIKNLTTAIEPILLVVLGVSVGFLIISIISPIYGLITSIQ